MRHDMTDILTNARILPYQKCEQLRSKTEYKLKLQSYENVFYLNIFLLT